MSVADLVHEAADLGWPVENLQQARLQMVRQHAVAVLESVAEYGVCLVQLPPHRFVLHALPDEEKRRAGHVLMGSTDRAV